MNIKSFIKKIKLSTKIVFFTGAGISTESGVPDYRSPNGIWSKYEPVYYQDFVSNQEDRIRYWAMKKETHELYKKVKPNIAHTKIAELEKSGQIVGVITQNVDGLHRLAGTSHEKLVEIHGTDRKVKCISCGLTDDADPYFKALTNPPQPPTCPKCKGYLKPATISFGQNLDPTTMDRAENWAKDCDLFIVVGSSLQVQPAASYPIIAKDHGAFLAIINREYTPQDVLANFVYTGEIGEFFNQV